MKKILTYIKNSTEEIKSFNQELINISNYFADKNNLESYLVGVNFTHTEISQIEKLTSSQIININIENDFAGDDTYLSSIINEICNKFEIDLIILSSLQKEIAPRIAYKQNSTYIADIISLEIIDNNITVSKSIISGKAIQTGEITGGKCVLSIRPKLFAIPEDYKFTQSPNTKEVIEFKTTIENIQKVKVVSKNQGTKQNNLSEANIIVSAGRGVKDNENHKLIQELANKLSAAVGASRAIVDSDMRPHSEQIGQTGKVVSPDLYIACGISGAIQHLAGMNNSKIILAINSDKDANIFSYADYGIIGDINKVIPTIIELI